MKDLIVTADAATLERSPEPQADILLPALVAESHIESIINARHEKSEKMPG